MRKLTFITMLGALVLAGIAATVAFAATTVPFTAKYAGTAVTKATDNVVDITANGKGTGTLIGLGKITGAGKGDSSQQPCVPFTGLGKMSGPGGTITFKVNPQSSGCGDEVRQALLGDRQGDGREGDRQACEGEGNPQDDRFL